MNEFKHFSELEHKPVTDCLALTLTLNIKGASENIPGANIKFCHLNLFSFGFSGDLGFWLPVEQRSDKLIEHFSTEELIEVELSIIPVLNLPEPAPQALKVNGLVTTKSIQELHYSDLSGRPVLYRYYQICFSDPAKVLWKQHYPCELYVEQSMATAIKAQIPASFKLALELDSLGDVQPMICLGLGQHRDVNVGGGNNPSFCVSDNLKGTINHQSIESHAQTSASFYDFLVAYLKQNNAFLLYDYTQQTYLITDEKLALTDNKGFFPHEVASVSNCWPETARSNVKIMNAVADNSQQELIDNAVAVDGIRQDQLFRFAIASQFTNQKSQALKRLANNGQELSIHFSQWPLQSFYPNIGFKVDSKVWGNKALYANQAFRAYQVKINIQAIDNNQEDNLDTKHSQYQLDYQSSAELVTSTKQRLPVVSRTNYPIYVEGKIVSTIGEDTDKTYDIAESKDTGQSEYQVYIPLWDKTIKILFEPDHMNSHFYFPYYRDNKVLVSFDLFQATIIKVLSWGERVRLPNATQGNHILFGKNENDETSFRHVYEESKPVLSIKRQKEKDTELVRLEEGSIILQTCEEK